MAWTSGGRGRGQTSKCPRQEEENAVLPKSSPMQGLVSLLGDPRSTARTLRGTSWERGPEGAAVTEAGGRAGRGRGPNGAGTAGGLGGAWEERSRPRPRRAHRRAHRPPPPTPPLPPRASRRPRHLAAGDLGLPARLPDCGVGTGAAAAPAAHKAPDGAAAPPRLATPAPGAQSAGSASPRPPAGQPRRAEASSGRGDPATRAPPPPAGPRPDRDPHLQGTGAAAWGRRGARGGYSRRAGPRRAGTSRGRTRGLAPGSARAAAAAASEGRPLPSGPGPATAALGSARRRRRRPRPQAGRPRPRAPPTGRPRPRPSLRPPFPRRLPPLPSAPRGQSAPRRTTRRDVEILPPK